MANREEADLFALPDFWKRPVWFQEAPKVSDNGFFNLKIGGHDEVTLFLGKDGLPEQNGEDVFFKIPAQLCERQPTPSPDGDKTEQLSTVAPIQEPSEPSEASAADGDDLWLDLTENELPALPEYKTWASFEHDEAANSVPLFASEQGPDTIDALVAAEDGPLSGGSAESVVLDPSGYCNCLLALALGRSSVLFSWDDSKRCFAPLQESPRIPGFTGPILRSVEKTCLECGTHSRSLRAFVDRSFTSATAARPSRAALARAVDRTLLTIQSELGIRGQKTRSLLQLQTLIRPVAALVKYVHRLVAKLSQFAADDGMLLSALFQEAQSMEHGAVLLREVTKQVLQIVSEPWLGFAGAWIGLDPQSKATLWAGDLESKAFVRYGDRVWVDDMGIENAESDYFLDAEKMPAFIPDDMAQALFETGRNLRFLWTNHPEHPLSDPATFAQAGPPPLRWQFDWGPISEAERVARGYELALAQAVAMHPQGRRRPCTPGQRLPSTAPLPSSGIDMTPWRMPTLELHFFGQDDDQAVQNTQPSLARLDALTAVLRQWLFDDDVYRDACRDDEKLDLNDFPPHWSLLPLLSFGPVVSAQARLVSRACMKLMFGVHNVREHLRVQRAFQLLGNGGFCSRLSHALFDPDLARAGSRTGVQLSSEGMGLRLSGRETWPPASSEMRLALMGVLAESYDKRALPGAMSFAVRDLSPEEMEKCMDPDSLEALDFLRLSYKPPVTLQSVITPSILSRYDRVFRLLLRVLRMYYVANQLSREAHGQGDDVDHVATRFCIEAHHFVANMMAYFLDTGVGLCWQRFEAWLDGVQGALDGDSNGEAAHETNPDRLRERHEQCVDEIMAALFLRKRQQPLLDVLQDIFGTILAFAQVSRHRRRVDSAAEPEVRQALSERTQTLYLQFRKKLGVFLTVCRGLSEKEANSAARRGQAGQASEQGQQGALLGLLLVLDYNGFYAANATQR